jgi:PKD domain
MKRDILDLLIGLFVLGLGLAVLLFTLSNALALVAAPGTFLQNQLPKTTQAAGPSAAFNWTSNSMDLAIQDTARQGDSAIRSWAWDFGDGNRTSGQNPGPHTYANPGAYQITLTVQDANGLQSIAIAQAQIVPSQPRSGVGVATPSVSLPPGSLNFNNLLLPVGIGVLTIGLFVVMAMVGGAITRAGWNLLKPRADMIRIRLKPKHLTQAFEQDVGTGLGSAIPPPP